MAFVPSFGIVLAELRMTLFGQQIENTLYFDFQDVINTGMLDELGAYLVNWWDTAYSLPLSSQLALREVFLTDLTTNTGIVGTTPSGGDMFGKDDAPSVPGNVALAVSFRTFFRGRSARGRNYVPGIPNDQVTGNQVSTLVVSALQDAYVTLRNDHTLNTVGIWGVLSRFHNGVPRTAGDFNPITNVVIVDPFVDSQRRRLTGRGT